MRPRIDQFCEEFRRKLSSIESGLQGLNERIDIDAHKAEPDVRQHLARVQTRIEQGRRRLANAHTDMDIWIEHKKTANSDLIAEWKQHDRSKLENRVTIAERGLTGAMDVAVAALDAVERASLEAWLARHDANADTRDNVSDAYQNPKAY
jgi:hypothetical protein